MPVDAVRNLPPVTRDACVEVAQVDAANEKADIEFEAMKANLKRDAKSHAAA